MSRTTDDGRMRLGFMPLNDCAPLAVAEAKGFFADEGLDVELVREASWANIRDKTSAGLLDGAQMLAPLALAATLRLGGCGEAMVVPMALSLNGNAITLSTRIAAAMRALDEAAFAERPVSARALKRLIEERRGRGMPPLVFASVFPFSSHLYELRWWMEAGGVDPDRDVRLVVAPPPRMASMLGSGEIDGFCAGEPWNTVARVRDAGEIVAAACDLWPTKPEKVLGVNAERAAEKPNTLRGVQRALLRAGAWADETANRPELAAIVARPDYVGATVAEAGLSLAGDPLTGETAEWRTDFTVFHRWTASFPWISHALWFLERMRSLGQLPDGTDLEAVARRVYRPDLWRQAADDLGLNVPTADSKVEGAHEARWKAPGEGAPIPMAADRFFEGAPFDPAKF
jgi:nitrate/nitrite transport system substrate-binding protein